jgi:hypothetical protein
MKAVVEFTHVEGEKLPVHAHHPRGALDGGLQSWGVHDSRSHIVSLKKLGSRDEEIARLYAARCWPCQRLSAKMRKKGRVQWQFTV